MKVQHVLLPLAAAMMIAGCGNRGKAQNVVAQADAAVTRVKDQAAVSAPDQLKAVDGTLTHMKQNLDDHNYKVVINDVPQFNTQIKAVEDAVATKETAAAAATQEWTTLNSQVPKAVEEIQAKVDSLKPNALPKEVTKDELETAKKDLETVKSTWAEATNSANNGDLVAAAGKGRTVQAKVVEIKNSLGMTEQLASINAAPAGTDQQ
jgi:predicted  nucleic acid-binding Zn-ribbon protein